MSDFKVRYEIRLPEPNPGIGAPSGVLRASDVEVHNNACLRVWVGGRRWHATGASGSIFTEPDYVLNPSAWVFYRAI